MERHEGLKHAWGQMGDQRMHGGNTRRSSHMMHPTCFYPVLFFCQDGMSKDGFMSVTNVDISPVVSGQLFMLTLCIVTLRTNTPIMHKTLFGDRCGRFSGDGCL
eukprot:1160463-Pelagomonas_calceolata.AAC.6